MLFTKKKKLRQTLAQLEVVMEDIREGQRMIDEVKAAFLPTTDIDFALAIQRQQSTINKQKYETMYLKSKAELELKRAKFYE